MRIIFMELLTLLAVLIITLNYSNCTSSITNIKLNQEYNFAAKQLITTFVIPSGNPERDETYIRVLHLDFQARGYKVIDANHLLNEYSDKIYSKNHREIVDSLQSKKFLPSSEIYAVVSATWDSAYVLTFYSEDRYIHWTEYQFAGLNVPTLNSQVSFFDKSIRNPIKVFTASDTTYILSEDDNAELFYPEYPWMVIAKQLSRELGDIPICSIAEKTKAKNQLKVSFWVDKSYREAFPDTWMKRLQLRTLYANDILSSQLDIQVTQLEFVEWNTSFDRKLDNSLEKLYQTTSSNPSTLQIGITLNKDLKRNWTDKSELGFAYLLSNDAVITAQPSFPSVGQYWNSIEESITLVHEIAHILGAIHIPDDNSIMYPNAGSLSYEFDDVNKKIIDATKTNFIYNDTKERLISYSRELIKIKDFPSLNANPILPAIASIVELIDQRSQIITENSEKTFSKLSNLLPDSAIVLSVIGYIEFKNNKYKNAENTFTQALKISPDFAEAQYYLSLVLQINGDNVQANKYKNLAKPYSKFWVIDK